MATPARIALAAVLFAGIAIVALPRSDALAQSNGFNSLFIGHSFFNPFAAGMPFHAAQAGIVGHTQSTVTAGGANGAPQALWEDTTKRAQIQTILDGGDIELFGMTYHPNFPTSEGYENWIDYALAQNPNTRFALALPWATNPESASAATYASDWHLGHSTAWHDLIDALRALYPSVEIYCIPYGQSALELRQLFAAGNLDDVDFLVSATGNAIYSDSFGHADDILIDTGQLVWLNTIYDVDLTTYAYDPGYIADVKGIAQSIMDAHDAAYAGPPSVPAMSPWGAAVLATGILGIGAWSILGWRKTQPVRCSAWLGRTLFNREMRVPGNLPKKAVRIREITRVPAPENLLAWLHKRGSSINGLLKGLVDLFGRGNVVCEGETTKPGTFRGNGRVLGESLPRIKGQPCPASLEKGDPFGSVALRKAESLAIEANGAIEVRNAGVMRVMRGCIVLPLALPNGSGFSDWRRPAE